MILSAKPFTPSQEAFHESILALEDAFKRGELDFFHGQRVPVRFTKAQKIEVKKRSKALAEGNTHRADKIAMFMFLNGMHLSDIYLGDETENVAPDQTVGEHAVMASNPYTDGSLLAKEWERGFNTAYFRNLARIKYNESQNKRK
jgi:hypothetical protein